MRSNITTAQLAVEHNLVATCTDIDSKQKVSLSVGCGETSFAPGFSMFHGMLFMFLLPVQATEKRQQKLK